MCQASKMLPRPCRNIPCPPCLGCCGILLLELRRPPSMQHRFIRRRGGATELQAGLSVEPSRAAQAVPGREKTPPGSCSVAVSDRSQCDWTGPAAVWADDQAVTRAFAGPEVATADVCKRMVPANDDEQLQDPAACGKRQDLPKRVRRMRCQFLVQRYSLTRHSTRQRLPLLGWPRLGR